jgi:bifunctional oligoribonuclease and PAP phosphatase NrnA
MQNENFDGSLDLNKEWGWPVVADILTDPRKVLIITHKNPDGDAVGSALGLMWILRSLGHTADVAIPDDSPQFLKWLPGHQEIAVFDRKSGTRVPELFNSCNLVICADFNTPERVGDMETLYRQSTKQSFLIDHHPDGEIFTRIRLVDPSKGSTSELVYLMIQKTGFTGHISPDAATCLLAGIMTDTVGLKVSSSYPEVFESVAELMRHGADKDRIYHEIYNMFSADRMRLLGYSLDKNMKIIPDYRTAYIALTRSELNAYNHRKGDTEGFVNYPLSIAGVVFSVLFTEQNDHIKLSLRSRGTFPANEVARKHFLGGGHINAAGGRFFGTMKEATDRFESILDEYRDLLVEGD